MEITNRQHALTLIAEQEVVYQAHCIAENTARTVLDEEYYAKIRVLRIRIENEYPLNTWRDTNNAVGEWWEMECDTFAKKAWAGQVTYQWAFDNSSFNIHEALSVVAGMDDTVFDAEKHSVRSVECPSGDINEPYFARVNPEVFRHNKSLQEDVRRECLLLIESATESNSRLVAAAILLAASGATTEDVLPIGAEWTVTSCDHHSGYTELKMVKVADHRYAAVECYDGEQGNHRCVIGVTSSFWPQAHASAKYASASIDCIYTAATAAELKIAKADAANEYVDEIPQRLLEE